MQLLAAAIERMPDHITQRLFRWRVKVDEPEGVGWLSRRQALAYAMGLSVGGVDCSVIGPRGRCYFVRAGSFNDSRGTW